MHLARLTLASCLVMALVVAGAFVWRWRRHPRASIVAMVACIIFALRMVDDLIFTTCCQGGSNGRPGEPLLASVMNLLSPAYLHFLPVSFTLLTIAAFMERGGVRDFLVSGWSSHGRPVLAVAAGVTLHLVGTMMWTIGSWRIDAMEAPLPWFSDLLWIDHHIGHGVVLALLAYGVLTGRLGGRGRAAADSESPGA